MSVVKQIREPRVDHLELEKPALLRGFELLATAEGGVAKLRELILSLAVQGKLVRQEESDGSASVLLANIAAKKSELVASGKIRKPKKRPALASINEDLPPGWCSVVLEDICTVITDGDHLPPPKAETGVPFLVIGDVRFGRIDLSQAERFVPPEYFSALDWSRRPRAGDVLYTTVGSFGIPVLVVRDQDFCFQRHIALLRPGIPTLQPYLYLALQSPAVFAQASSGATGIAQKTVGLAVLRAISVALPPLAEQHRIVARVEELMTLCDELEARGRLADEQHARLTTTLFDALTASDSTQTLADNWQRIATHFDLLLDRPQAIDALEQTILQLAVRGLLVPQDASDEPISSALARAAAFIQPSAKTPEEDWPFDLPPSWEWRRLASLDPDFQNGISSRGDANGIPITVIRLADITNGRLSLNDPRVLPISAAAVLKYGIDVGDILVIRVNGSADLVGKFVRSTEKLDAIYCDHFIRMRLPSEVLAPAYLELVGSSKVVRGEISKMFITTAGQKTINQGHIGALPLPIPPLAEQHRIVARVEHLRHLCADLRERLNQSRDTQTHLAEALVADAVHPQRVVRLG